MKALLFNRKLLVVTFLCSVFLIGFGTFTCPSPFESTNISSTRNQFQKPQSANVVNTTFSQTNPSYTGSVPTPISQYNINQVTPSFSTNVYDNNGDGKFDSEQIQMSTSVPHNGSVMVSYFTDVMSNITGSSILNALNSSHTLITENTFTHNFYFEAPQTANYTFAMRIEINGNIIANKTATAVLYQSNNFIFFNPTVNIKDTDSNKINDSFTYNYNYGGLVYYDGVANLNVSFGLINNNNSKTQIFQYTDATMFSNDSSFYVASPTSDLIYANITGMYYLNMDIFFNNILVSHYNTTFNLQRLQNFLTVTQAIIQPSIDSSEPNSIWFAGNAYANYNFSTNITWTYSFLGNNSGSNVTLGTRFYTFIFSGYQQLTFSHYFAPNFAGTVYSNLEIYVNGSVFYSNSASGSYSLYPNSFSYSPGYYISNNQFIYNFDGSFAVNGGGYWNFNFTALDQSNNASIYANIQNFTVQEPAQLYSYSDAINLPSTGLYFLITVNYINSTGFEQNFYTNTINSKDYQTVVVSTYSGGVIHFNSTSYYALPIEVDLTGYGNDNITIIGELTDNSNSTNKYNLSTSIEYYGSTDSAYLGTYAPYNGTFTLNYFVYSNNVLLSTGSLGSFSFIHNTKLFSSINNVYVYDSFQSIYGNFQTNYNAYFFQPTNAVIKMDYYYFDSLAGIYRFLDSSTTTQYLSGYYSYGIGSYFQFSAHLTGKYIAVLTLTMNGVQYWNDTFLWNDAQTYQPNINMAPSGFINVNPYIGSDSNSIGITDSYMDVEFYLLGGPYSVKITESAYRFNPSTGIYVLAGVSSENATYTTAYPDYYYLGTGYYATQSGNYLMKYEVFVNGVLVNYQEQSISMVSEQSSFVLNNDYLSINIIPSGLDLEYTYSLYTSISTNLAFNYTIQYWNSSTNSWQLINQGSYSKTILGGVYFDYSLPTILLQYPNGLYNYSYQFFINGKLIDSSSSTYPFTQQYLSQANPSVTSPSQIYQNDYYDLTGSFTNSNGSYLIQIDGNIFNSNIFFTRTSFELKIGSLTVGTHTITIYTEDASGLITKQYFQFTVLANPTSTTSTTTTTSVTTSTTTPTPTPSTTAGTISTSKASPGFEVLMVILLLGFTAFSKKRFVK